MTFLKFILVGMLVFGSLSAFADMISPSHNCSKPMKPSHFASHADQAVFDRQVGAFKQCLSKFINEQNKEARLHSEAARQATNELKGVGG
jgi:hypothetical protein